MKHISLLLAVLCIACSNIQAQSIGIGTNSPNNSAMLDITSNSKGLLVPRVNLSGLNDGATIANPATSLLVYNTNAALTGGTGYYYNSGTPGAPAWTKMATSASAGWSLTGNAGTDPATNFIGTTDNGKPLKFRVANVPSGFIDHSTRSTFFGGQAGQNHTFTSNNSSTGFGYGVMAINVGGGNTAIGALALGNNNGGGLNSAMGYEALYNNIFGSRNVAVGNTSLRNNTNGNYNVAIGDSAMANNTTGLYNTAIGTYALKNNLTSHQNVALGYYALENNTASSNTALGAQSMRYNTSGSLNTAVGHSSLTNNISGLRNAAVGYQAMEANNTGQNNTAMGYSALTSNTTGVENTAIGYIALNSNISGDFNVAVGAYALAANRVDGNTAIGYEALRSNFNAVANIAIGKSALRSQSFSNNGFQYGSNNVAIGADALYSNQPTATTNGIKNIALGNYVLRSNTTGRYNIGIGHESLNNNTTGYWNCALGIESMLFNTTGYSNISIGTNNLRSNTSGNDNISIGIISMYSNTTGEGNTSIGYGAMHANTTGINNTAIGYGAGSFNNANDHCTFLGYEADQNSGSNYSASTAIGYNARISASSQVRIGHSTIASIGGYQPWSNLSDGRFKKNITEQVQGLDFIMALRPVTYNLDIDKLSGYLEEDVYKDAEGKKQIRQVSIRTKNERAEQAKMIHTGFVAQEVEAAANKLHYNFSGIDKPKNADDLYALRYSEFVVPLVKGMQEQQVIIERLEKKIAQLESMLLKLAGSE